MAKRLRECPCGSGEFPEAQYDARGIFLRYTCPKCEKEKLSGYRPEVLTDPQYETCEEIEEDEELKGAEEDWNLYIRSIEEK